LESQWTPESLENNFKGQNPLDWWVRYVTENLLQHECLKWALMTHLDISNTRYGQKKGQKSNCVLQPHFEGVWGWHSHSRNGDLGVFHDSRKLRAQLQGSKHPALKCSLYHWKGLET
jgi:hypothetical protein